MRPKKLRRVRCGPGERLFKPQCGTKKKTASIALTLDEFEALRLSYLEGHDQQEVATLMGVHRSTISRMLHTANTKLADALVNLKAIRIEGGCCKFVKKKRRREA